MADDHTPKSGPVHTPGTRKAQDARRKKLEKALKDNLLRRKRVDQELATQSPDSNDIKSK